MVALLCLVFAILASSLKSKIRLEAENTALQHQLIVLRRPVRGPGPAYEDFRSWPVCDIGCQRLDVRSQIDCVAKVPLKRTATRDSIQLNRSSSGASHDGSAEGWTRPVLLLL